MLWLQDVALQAGNRENGHYGKNSKNPRISWRRKERCSAKQSYRSAGEIS
jgi:hypothetical protein